MNRAKPKMLFFTPQFGRRGTQGGVGVSSERIAHHLNQIFEVHLLTCEQDLPPLSRATSQDNGIFRHELGFHPDAGIRRKALLDRALELHSDQSFEELTAFYISGDSFALALAAREADLPLTSFCRGNDIHTAIFSSESFQIYETLKSSRLCICPSTEMERQLQTFCPEAQTGHLPNGVDIELFSPPSNYCFRSMSPEPVVGLFGDVKSKKGLPLLLEAINFNRFKLKIVGSLRPDMEKLLHGFVSLHDSALSRIEVVPRIESISGLIDHYLSCDIVCIPSLYDGMPNVMLEAMALGKVCIASSTGGMLDVIEDRVSGFLFRVGGAAQLSDLLTEVVTLPERELREVSEQARYRVSSHFSMQHECDRLQQVFSATGD
jgi:glycosyltransferase involved in cell wall biosynthesis